MRKLPPFPVAKAKQTVESELDIRVDDVFSEFKKGVEKFNGSIGLLVEIIAFGFLYLSHSIIEFLWCHHIPKASLISFSL